MQKDFNLKCQIKKTFSSYFDKKIVANIYFICPQVTAQLAVFYKRDTFLWVGADESSLTSTVFGDVPRAINKYIS